MNHADIQTILSYNLLEGLQQSRIQEDVFVKWVNDLDPDIIFYQELNGISEEDFAELAACCGHPFAVKMKEDGYRVGISSKYEITHIERKPEGSYLGYIYAKVQNYHLFALHLHPFKEEIRLGEIRTILTHAQMLPPDAQVMLLGDYNSLARSDQSAYDDPEFIAHKQSLNPDISVAFAVTDAILEAGYTDAYTLFHSDFKRTFPTAKRIMPGDCGSRIDYAFLSPTLKEKCISAEVVHDKITRFLSDHYPLIIRLER